MSDKEMQAELGTSFFLRTRNSMVVASLIRNAPQ
jgi:hypothetical protein